MAECTICGQRHSIGFVATRLAGTDGVSLETAKWADIFQKAGCDCFYFAGELDRPAERSYLVAEAHFRHPEIRAIYNNCFGVRRRDRQMTQKIYEYKEQLKDELYKFIARFDIELLIPQNSLTIPLHLPLGYPKPRFRPSPIITIFSGSANIF